MGKNIEKQGDITEHLGELRTRLIRTVIYCAVGTGIAWLFYDWLFAFLTKPMMTALKTMDTKFLLTGFPEAFVLQMQVCLISGLVLVSPFVTFELWGFVSPGLTAQERKPLRWIAPLTVLLFFSGVVLCYSILPVAFSWFASYIPKGAELRPSIQGSILFTVKMLLAFGLVFELPVVLMFLAKVGIVNSKLLRQNWRIAMVLTSILAAVATPSSDAFSMLMMALPLAVLYFFSILLVRFVERSRPVE